MKFVLRFIKPYWKLLLFTLILLIVDVVGALLIPTLAAEMMNAATLGSGFDTLIRLGIIMVLVSVA